MDEQIDMTQQMNIITTVLDSYIDLLDYDKPNNYITTRISSELTTEDTRKAHYITVMEVRIETDSGIIMEDIETETVFQLDTFKSDIFNGDCYYKLNIGGNNIADNHFRRYVKVQDIIARLGGLINFLITIASLLVQFFATMKMRLDITNSLFNIQDDHKDSKADNSSNSNGQLNNKDNINVVRFCHLKNVHNINSKGSKPIKASVVDYMRSLFKCRSIYNQSLYKQFNNIVCSKLEITNIIQDSLCLENFVSVLPTENQSHSIEAKRIIIPGVNINSKLKGAKQMVNKENGSPGM
jgi:hypothetical protein